MALPINVNDLLNKNKVEGNRIELFGSPRAVIETDAERTYFLIDIPCREDMKLPLADVGDRVKRQGNDRVERQSRTTELGVLEYCLSPRSRKEILDYIGLKYHSDNFKRHILPLMERGLLVTTSPDSPSSPRQKYVVTDEGRKALSL